MAIKLRPVAEQTLVITGASSGIGLATARAAAGRGARVVLAARSETALRETVEEMRSHGAEAHYRVLDVADFRAVLELADWVGTELGGFDTWVNNAAVSIYGEIDKVPVEDARRLFDVNYWGMVHGVLAALPHLRERGGAIVNVGSVASERAIPLQGHYAASKHAVKGFTEALRMELEKAGTPVSLSLVKPASIATPYPHHARNYLEGEPTVPSPLYDPRVVAAAILECAARPIRDLVVGGSAALSVGAGKLAPRLTDRMMEATMFDSQVEPKRSPLTRADALYTAGGDGSEHGMYDRRIRRSSAYTGMRLHPIATMLTAGALALLATGAIHMLSDSD